MKRLIFIISLLLSFSACNESGNKKEKDTDARTSSEGKTEKSEPTENYGMADTIETGQNNTYETPSEKNSQEERTASASTISGKYIKDDHKEDTDCSCYCVDIALSGISELCLAENKLYINARFEKTGNKIKVYYNGKSAKTSDTEIPWDKFDKSVIAEITPQAGDGLKLDWKGFSIDNEIAVDYALYGKKTLEGTYKKL